MIGADTRRATLQWGRNLIVAEGGGFAGAQAVAFNASMGPQLDSCGRSTVVIVPIAGSSASMGPQLDSCGR